MAEVTWSPHSLDDLQQIIRDLARESISAAEDLAEDFIEMSYRLGEFPYLGRVFPDTNREDVRVLVVRNHRLIYRVLEGNVEILRIIDGARRVRPSDLPF